MNHLILNIRAIINKSLEYFKYNKNDPYEGMKIMIKISHSNYLFVTESMDDYLIGNRLTKRKLIVLILQLCIWAFTLKSLFISYYRNKTFLIMTGDFTYLCPRPDIVNVLPFLLFGSIALIGKNL